MIQKPRDLLTAGFNRVIAHNGNLEDPRNQLCFTASECAEIARAYNECSQYVEWIAGEHAEPEIVNELVAWNLKFAEWLK